MGNLGQEYYRNFEQAINREKRLLHNSDNIHSDNKELILEHVQDCIETAQIKPPTVYRKLIHLRRVFSTPSLNANAKSLLSNVDAIKTSLRQLERKYQNGVAKDKPLELFDYKKCLKSFFKWLNHKLTEEDSYPKCVQWIKNPRTENDLTADDVLTPEEISLLVNNAQTLRDKAPDLLSL